MSSVSYLDIMTASFPPTAQNAPSATPSFELDMRFLKLVEYQERNGERARSASRLELILLV